MKDELNELFRERFAGHEAPVDAGLWDAIQGQLSVGSSAAGEEGVKDLFQERFSGHEVPVDPGVWASISSQLGHGVAATSAGGVVLGPLGWAAAGIGVLVLAGAAYFFSPSTTPEALPAPRVEQVAPAPQAVPSSVAPAVEPEQSKALAANTGSSAPSSIPTPAVAPAPQKPVPEVVPGIHPADLPTAPEPARAGAQGAVIVENIISELTTRVTEEVLAEAAQRTTLVNTPPEVTPEAPYPEGIAEEEVALPELFLHNTFTPNGDGVNDTYFAVINPEAFQRIMLRVHDVRNNRLVFSTNTNEPWTGDGCQDGYYLVAVEAVTPNGRLVTQGKVVWLNRNTVR